MNNSAQPGSRLLTGIPALVVLAAGQLISAIGTRMTNFVLAIYVYNATGSATQLTTMTMCALLATAVFSPLAGALVDRWPRRVTIMVSDAGALLVTLALLALFASGRIEVWHLYVVNVLTGGLMAFQVPAYISTISMIVDRKNYPRASAIFSITRSAPAVIAPGVAAPVLAYLGMNTILTIDSLSYVAAVVTVFLVAFPVVAPKARKGVRELLPEMGFGFRYIWSRPAMRGLEIVQFLTILLSGFGAVLITPLLLERTGSVEAVGLVSSIGAAGGVVGAVLLSVLKPPRRKVLWMLAGTAVFGIVGRALFGFADTVAVWSFAWLTTWFCLPFMNSYGHAIWQEKVDPKVQGRVFATRQLVEGIGIPIAVGAAGPLADAVFEPQMRPGHLLGDVFGPLLGTSPGSGVAFMYVLTGALLALLAVVGWAVHSVRDIEVVVPDFVEPEARTAESTPAKTAQTQKTEV